MVESRKNLLVFFIALMVLLNFTTTAAFSFDIPKKEELELKAKARMKYVTLDLTKVTFTDDEKKKIDRDFEENYSLDISDYDPATKTAIVTIIARRFDNMPMIRKWYFDGNIWRDDIDPGIIVDPAMPKWPKKN
jgi:exopolysaccharide biosynthesis protein